jgi:TonB family protein
VVTTAATTRRDPFSIGATLVTLLVHGGIAFAIWRAHAAPTAPVLMPRDFMVAKIVRLGKKREPKLLPTIPVPPPPIAPKSAIKLTDNDTAKATPPTEKKPPDAKPGDLSRALAHAKLLEQRQAQMDQEGDPNGDPSGNSDSASPGDLYATALYKAYHEEWRNPQLAAAQNLLARVRIFVDPEGNVLKATLVQPSGNGPFDDSVTEVLTKVKRLPKPPAALALRMERSGLVLEFTP